MEPTFLSKREPLDRMLSLYYECMNRHLPFRRALERLARELAEVLGHPPGLDAAGRRDPSVDYWPHEAAGLLRAFADHWALPRDVGMVDVWDSLCDGPRARPPPPMRRRSAPTRRWRSFTAFLRAHPSPRYAGRPARGSPSRRYLLRVGARRFPGIELTPAELDAMDPEDMEPDGWVQPSAALQRPMRSPHTEAAAPSSDASWSDLMRYDPSGIVGDITTRSAARGGVRRIPASKSDIEATMDATEARLRVEGFDRPGPWRRRDEDLPQHARWLFMRAVLRMTWTSIVDEMLELGVVTEETLVGKVTRPWAKELRIPLPPRGAPRRPKRRSR